MDDIQLAQTHIDVPSPLPGATGLRRLWRLLLGALLTPWFLLMAMARGAPGIAFHRRCAALGLRMLRNGRRPLPLGWAYEYIFYPMDSTRYFEFDALWRFHNQGTTGRHLDISSPRQFPLVLLNQEVADNVVMINPDRKDLAVTARLAAALGLSDRCRLICSTIGDAPLSSGTFDLITCISVLEHIQNDVEAVRRMWELLRPGGRLLLSVPCAACASAQYINTNEYGLLAPDEQGYVFWQRYYDASLLQTRVFSQIGQPAKWVLYGERQAGSFRRNAERKRRELGATYPHWREAYMMATEYAYFTAIEDLPGEGVIALEFRKP